jgi:ribosomal protein L37E
MGERNIKDDERCDKCGQAMWSVSRGYFCSACGFLHCGCAGQSTSHSGCKFQNTSQRASSWTMVKCRGEGRSVR